MLRVGFQPAAVVVVFLANLIALITSRAIKEEIFNDNRILTPAPWMDDINDADFNNDDAHFRKKRADDDYYYYEGEGAVSNCYETLYEDDPVYNEPFMELSAYYSDYMDYTATDACDLEYCKVTRCESSL